MNMIDLYKYGRFHISMVDFFKCSVHKCLMVWNVV